MELSNQGCECVSLLWQMYNKINLIEKYKTLDQLCKNQTLCTIYDVCLFRIACEITTKLVELFTNTSRFIGTGGGAWFSFKKAKYIRNISLRFIKNKRSHVQRKYTKHARTQFKEKENMARIDYYYRSISTSTHLNLSKTAQIEKETRPKRSNFLIDPTSKII